MRGALAALISARGAPTPTAPIGVIGGVGPAAAYGTRKLDSSYNGPCVRVRRASDSAELDIGFSGNLIDSAALDAFIFGTTGFVRTWYDQSGNANDATQTTTALQPQIDSRLIRGCRTIYFDHAQKLVIPSGVATNANAVTGLLAMAPIGYTATAGYVQLGTDYNFFSQHYMRTSGAGSAPGIVQRNNMAIIGFRQNGSASLVFADDETQTDAALGASAKTGGYIGDLPGAGAFLIRGNCSAVIIYGRALTDTDLANGRSAMHSEFNVREASAGRIVGFGDSIFAGSVNNGYSPLTMVAEQFDGYRLVNFSEGGDKIADETTKITGTLAVSNYMANAVVVMNGGTNDVGLTTDDETTIYGRYTSFCSAVKAVSGTKLAIATILPAYYTGARETVRLAFNTLLRSNWASIADRLIDYAANPVMGAAGAPNDTTLYLDTVHPTPYGASLLIPETKAAIQVLLP